MRIIQYMNSFNEFLLFKNNRRQPYKNYISKENELFCLIYNYHGHEHHMPVSYVCSFISMSHCDFYTPILLDLNIPSYVLFICNIFTYCLRLLIKCVHLYIDSYFDMKLDFPKTTKLIIKTLFYITQYTFILSLGSPKTGNDFANRPKRQTV